IKNHAKMVKIKVEHLQRILDHWGSALCDVSRVPLNVPPHRRWPPPHHRSPHFPLYLMAADEGELVAARGVFLLD
ncbi:hypothetical protein KI387_025356, partial [Taxus chinensis]